MSRTEIPGGRFFYDPEEEARPKGLDYDHKRFITDLARGFAKDGMGPEQIVPAVEKVMRDLLPELNNSPEVPRLMKDTVESGAKGISNCRGFYKYTPEAAERWKELFHQFTFEIHRLAQRYPDDAARNMETKTSTKDTV